MPLLINGVPIDDAPRGLNSFFLQYPHFKESAARLCSMKPQVIPPHNSLYVSQREFAVSHPHDSRVSIIGTDDITNGHIVIIRHTSSGAVGCCQMDKVYEEGLTTLIERVQSLSYHYDGRLELHVLGGFADSKGVSHQLSIALLQCLHKQRVDLDLITCCLGDLCTLHRNGVPWPVLYGAAINVKTGDIFPATFTDKGPDLDIRNARTLTGGESVGLLDIYDYQREELRIGPFSYEPMRAVDIWLQQSDDFLLQNLSASPEVAPPSFIPHLRDTLKRIKEHPYPAVTLFPNNFPWFYRKDERTGKWDRIHHKQDIMQAPIVPPPPPPQSISPHFSTAPVSPPMTTMHLPSTLPHAAATTSMAPPTLTPAPPPPPHTGPWPPLTTHAMTPQSYY